MGQQIQLRCNHCNTPIVARAEEINFWIRCPGCGRRVMPKSWSEIVTDPEPSAVFEPVQKYGNHDSSGSKNLFRYSIISQWLRHKLYETGPLWRVVILTGFIISIATGFYTNWYFIFDSLLAGFFGMLLAVFVLFVPEVLVAIATGGLTLLFHSFMFGFYVNQVSQAMVSFLFGFVLAVVLQKAGNYYRKQLEIRAELNEFSSTEFEERAVHEGSESSSDSIVQSQKSGSICAND